MGGALVQKHPPPSVQGSTQLLFLDSTAVNSVLIEYVRPLIPLSICIVKVDSIMPNIEKSAAFLHF